MTIEKVRVTKKQIHSKSKTELEKIVWELFINYMCENQNTDEYQTSVFRRHFYKVKKQLPNFTDIEHQKCRLVNGKLYI